MSKTESRAIEKQKSLMRDVASSPPTRRLLSSGLSPTLSDGYENLLALEAIARSIETGAPVIIDEMREELG